MASKQDHPKRALDHSVVDELARQLESDVLRRERILREQLERTVEVLEQTRRSFRSKQLKKLREEIEGVLQSL
ncbi:MAG: hypothetical protein ACOC2L_02055 [Candidatus Sumerlaeota bacterium]